jgi:hypothetical protein
VSKKTSKENQELLGLRGLVLPDTDKWAGEGGSCKSRNWDSNCVWKEVNIETLITKKLKLNV